MKRILTIFIFVALLSGCTDQSMTNKIETSEKTSQGQQVSTSKKLEVITSFYPLYEIGTQIGGEKISVKNLVPAGVEPHDFEPTSRDLINLYNADLFLYNGAELEPWVERIMPDLEQHNVQVLDQSALLKEVSIENTMAIHGHEEEAMDKHPEQGTVAVDPHFWLDPELYILQTQAVGKKLIELDPAHTSYYEENTRKFVAKLSELHENYKINLKNCKNRTIVTSHAAFAYLAKRYDLEVLPISGISPGNEPSPKNMAEISKLVKEKHITTIFTETSVDPRITETIAKETGVKTLTLNPIESVSQKQIEGGRNYVKIMEENLQNLKNGLECNEF